MCMALLVSACHHFIGSIHSRGILAEKCIDRYNRSVIVHVAIPHQSQVAIKSLLFTQKRLNHLS